MIVPKYYIKSADYYVFSFISAFIVCWMPFILAGLLNLYGDLGYGGWFDILIALAPLNSMVNPIIFLTFNNRTFISRRKSTFRRADQLELMNIS